MARLALITTVLVTGALLAACRNSLPPRTAPPQRTAAAADVCAPPSISVASAPRSMEFRFGIGDEFTVDVWQEKDLTTPLRVLSDGTVSPQLVGSVHVAGRTIDEAKEMLTRRYREYIKEPVISVRVTAIHSDRVFVLGEVKTPQAVSITGPTTLVQAISQADGFLEEFADKSRVRIVRKGPDGQPLVTLVNVDAVLAARATDPVMQRGDVVWVPARGVTDWNRSLGQALAPFSVALGAAGSTAAIVGATGN